MFVEMLLSNGAHINHKSNDGNSCIIEASRRGNYNVVELLLSKGANINDKDNSGSSSIIKASMSGHVNVVELLLSKGADINDKNNDGWSSILWASTIGNMHVVALLLSKGADINEIADDGSTAISISDSDKITYMLQKWPITMAILIFKELSIYYQTDASTLIDLYQYLGIQGESGIFHLNL